MQIRVEDLSMIYNPGLPYETRALDHISVEIKPGEFVAIIGHTGSGKTTLVQQIAGLLEPTSGRVVAVAEDGTETVISEKGKASFAIRRKVGIVFQYPEYQLFEETVAQDIAFGPKNQGLSAEEIDQRVRYAMDCVHLDYEKYCDRSPFELSGGQMRRVAIAGVLAMKPSVLILDEPTAGLDPRGRDRILTMLEELHAGGNVTIVMVSHSMDDMARLATRLVVMAEGKILASGTPREIFAQEEMMLSAGLGVPEASRLCRALREKGLDLPADLYRPDELKEHLLRLWRKEGSPC